MNKTLNLDEYARAIIQISNLIKEKRELLKRIGKPETSQLKFKSTTLTISQNILWLVLFPLSILATVVALSEPTTEIYPLGGNPVGVFLFLYTVYCIVTRFFQSDIEYIRVDLGLQICVYLSPIIAYANYSKLGVYWDWKEFALLVLPLLLLSIGVQIYIKIMDGLFVKQATPDILIRSLINKNIKSGDVDSILYKAEELIYLELIDLGDSRINPYTREDKRVILILISLAIWDYDSDKSLTRIINGGDPKTLKELKKDGIIEAIFRNRNMIDTGIFERFNDGIETLTVQSSVSEGNKI